MEPGEGCPRAASRCPMETARLRLPTIRLLLLAARAQLDRGPLALGAANEERRADSLRALAHAEEAPPSALRSPCRLYAKATTIIDDSQPNGSWPICQDDGDHIGARVLRCIDDRFLPDAKHRVLERRRQHPRSPFDRE